MRTYSLAHNLKLIDPAPPIPGFEKFISVYVLQGKEVALIDVGPSTSIENLMSSLGELDIAPTAISYIFLTHIHTDHAGGIGKAIKQMPKATVVAHEKCAPHLVDPTRLREGSQQALGELALQLGPIEPVPKDRILIAEEGARFNLGGIEIEALNTPGHASHHLSFLDRGEKRLFAGEAAGNYIREIDSVRPATPHPFNLEQALASVDKLMSYAPTSLCYNHFGSAANALDKMSNYKKQLILWGSVIADGLEKEASGQEMYNEIRNKDEVLIRIDSLPSYQQQRELFFIKNNIRGFVSYFQRYGTESIKGKG